MTGGMDVYDAKKLNRKKAAVRKELDSLRKSYYCGDGYEECKADEGGKP